jgi:pyruvate formate lyase activating enzyme
MSLLDWDGMVATTLYLSGCNFRCPYCHNSTLVVSPDQYESIPIDEILAYVKEHSDFLDGVVVTGGEPCARKTVAELLARLKDLGIATKLDTNGSFPSVLERVIDDGLVDYIAMDIKAPLDFESYRKSAGISDRRTLDRVNDSIDLLMEDRVEYEFRMTVVPVLHKSSDLLRIGDRLRGATRFVLQTFVPRDTMIDPSFENEAPYDLERMEEFRVMLASFFGECIIRGE